MTDFSDGTNLAIRYGTGEWPNTIVQLLLSEPVYPVAGQHLAEEIGENCEPERLLDFPLVHTANESGWRNWFSHFGLLYRMRKQDLLFDNQLIVLKAVQHGLGIGLSRPCISTFFDRGDLVALGDARLPPESAFYLVRPRHRPLSLAARIYARELFNLAGIDPAAAAHFLE